MTQTRPTASVEWKERNCPASFGGHVGKITSDGGYFGCNNSVNSGLKQKPNTSDGYSFQ